MTADTVAACEVTRASAVSIANQTASELVPAGMRFVSRDTPEPFIVLELIAGPPGSLVTHQRQVTRRCNVRMLEALCRAAWVEMIALHRAEPRRYVMANGSAIQLPAGEIADPLRGASGG